MTGYSRTDIIPRNCRFLQGAQTDRKAVRRLSKSIFAGEETVELLLNYRKDGEPFWNLLYCAPLYDQHGHVSFFIGGQINCSTTILSCTDILKILSLSDEGDNESVTSQLLSRPESLKSRSSSSAGLSQNGSRKASFFQTFKRKNAERAVVRDEAGMENELLEQVGNLNFKNQVEAFYTAYSKVCRNFSSPLPLHFPSLICHKKKKGTDRVQYIVMTCSTAGEMVVKHYSVGITDLLCTKPHGIVPLYHKDIFTVLAEHSPPSTPSYTTSLSKPSFFGQKLAPGVLPKGFRSTVRDRLRVGEAVSLELNLWTGEMLGEREMGGPVGGREGRDGKSREERRVEDRFVTHWTPLKDEAAKIKWVVLTIAPRW